MAKSKTDKNLEDSPLMREQAEEGNGLSSTIHPERFDMTRFSERRDEEESSFRIILYVVVVIIIGVGLALLVRFLISDNGEDTEDTNQGPTEQVDTDTDQDTRANAVRISTTPQPDSTSAPVVTAYETASLKSIGNAAVSAEGLAVSGLRYDTFTSYRSLEFSIDGVTAGSTLPEMTLEFDEATQTMKLLLPAGIEVDPELRNVVRVNDVVSSIVYSSITNDFTISFTEDVSYALEASVSAITINIRTEDDITSGEEDMEDEANMDDTSNEEETNQDEEQQEQEEQPDTQQPAPSEPSTPPSGDNIDNEFSQSDQFITNSQISGNTIAMNEIFYEDTGSYFEIAWGSRNNIGQNFIPNAQAQLVEDGNETYIEVQVQNLASVTPQGDITQQQIEGDTGINLSNANFASLEFISFTNGTATYRIQLDRVSDYKIVSTTTISGQTQVLAIQIQD